jgi:hypothetical protein
MPRRQLALAALVAFAVLNAALLVYSIRVDLLDASPVLTFAGWAAGALPVLASLCCT